MRAGRLALLAFSAMLDDLMMSDLAAVAGPVMNEEQKRSAATMVPEPQIRFQKSPKDQ